MSYMEQSDIKNENNAMKIVVNTITTCRLLGAIGLPFIYKSLGDDIAALCTLGIFATDAIDGFLARKFEASTFLGSLLDASSDKLLITISFVLLALRFPVMWAPLILEIMILATNYSIYRKGGSVIVSEIGRNKMILLSVCTVVSYLLIAMPAFGIKCLETYLPSLISLFGAIISGGSLLTLIDYFKKYSSIKKQETVKYKEIMQLKTFKEVLNDMVNHKYYLEHKSEPILKQLYK